jgi:hypothetical protein
MSDLAMPLVALFMIAMGVGMGAIWTIDIVRSPEVDRTHGLLRARDMSTRSLLVPHWLAEYGTAIVLVAGGIALLVGSGGGPWPWLIPAGLGALAYSSLNSLGWALADRARVAYAVPMLVGLIGAVVSLVLLAGGAVIAPAS